MTDKQIIIDGVDVNYCPNHYNGWSALHRDTIPMCECGYDRECKPKYFQCSYYVKCLEQKLQCKEQECEQQKVENETLKQYKGSKQASYETMQNEWNKAVNANRQLKKENEDLKNAYTRLNALYNENCNFTGKLEETLIEIIEIAKPYQKEIKKICGNCDNYDDSHACCRFDLNCYQYKKGDTKACDKFIELKKFEINNLANKILQKGVENEIL